MAGVCDYCGEAAEKLVTCDVCGARVCPEHDRAYGCASCQGRVTV